MSLLPNDIKDDEIRIISSERNLSVNTFYKEETENNNHKPDKPKWKLWVIITAILFIGGLCVFFWWEVKVDTEQTEKLISYPEEIGEAYPDVESADNVSIPVPGTAVSEKGFVETYDTVINKVPLTIFKPKNLTPKLHIGIDALSDTTASFVVQAADVRKDNGQIVGAYVSEGNLLSRGQSKAGFCAIINGKLIIGVADSTPYLEQAIETGGYFFRQYPLVVGGQIVDNKLKYSSLRKALAELNGEIVVIMNDKNQTLNEFSQTLVDLGVSNAIYLIGSVAPGFAIDEDGNRIDFGKEFETPSVNSNYIIWQ